MIWHKDLIQFLPDDILKQLCKDCITTLESVTGDRSLVRSEEIEDLTSYILLVLCEAYKRNLNAVDPRLTDLYNLLPEIDRLVPYHDIYSDLMIESTLKSNLYHLEDEYYLGKISEKDWIPIVSAFPEFNLMLKDGGLV